VIWKIGSPGLVLFDSPATEISGLRPTGSPLIHRKEPAERAIVCGVCSRHTDVCPWRGWGSHGT
jgi:hypothetical protein